MNGPPRSELDIMFNALRASNITWYSERGSPRSVTIVGCVGLKPPLGGVLGRVLRQFSFFVSNMLRPGPRFAGPVRALSFGGCAPSVVRAACVASPLGARVPFGPAPLPAPRRGRRLGVIRFKGWVLRIFTFPPRASLPPPCCNTASYFLHLRENVQTYSQNEQRFFGNL